MRQASTQKDPHQKACLYYSAVAFPLETLFLCIKPHLWLLVFRRASLKATDLATILQLTGICSICGYSF